MATAPHKGSRPANRTKYRPESGRLRVFFGPTLKSAWRGTEKTPVGGVMGFMKHSWQYAARRHPGGWLIALATAALVVMPGCSGSSPDTAALQANQKVDEHHFGAHLPTQQWHEVRPDHPHRDTFTFEGGVTVPQTDYRLSLRIRREPESHGRHHGRLPRVAGAHGGKVLSVSATNRGRTTWGAPVILVFDQVAGDAAAIEGACGHLATGEPYLCLQSSGNWGPGADTPKAEMRLAHGAPFAPKWHLEAMPLDTSPADPPNRAPVASAGPDQTAFVGETVTLDGAASMDPDGDPLSFAWHLDSAPDGSAAAPSDPHAVKPTLVLDRPGTYVLSLLVDDGVATSAPDTVQVSTQNSPPVADAGADTSAHVGDTVTLDGTGSSDVDGDPLDFSWTLVDAPAGSAAALDDPEAMLPTLTIDRAGTYELELVVTDGAADSAPDTVFITTINAPPIAGAGPDQTVALGATVGLDGALSFDPDGDPLLWWWSLTSVPAGSAAVLSDPAAEAPTFTADVPGTYVAQLVVSDGTMDSTPDTVTIDTANTRPVADAGLDRTVLAGAPVVLDGAGSHDPDGDPFTWFWAITGAPAASTAALDDPTAATPSFTPDLAGTYLVQLIVNDGDLASDPDTVVFTAIAPPAVSIDDVTMSEGNSGTTAFVFTVTRSGTALWDLSVDFATAAGSATGGTDYTDTSGTLTIPAGETSATITVDVLGDTVAEPDETFAVNLTNPVNATLADAQGTGTIRDDESATISINDVTLAEGNSGSTNFVFTVTRSGPLTEAVSLMYATAPITATGTSDYTNAASVLSLAAGQATGTITIKVKGDTIVEPDETFAVNLSVLIGSATLADGQGIGTILNDD
jgi:Calx-beta domain/PKD domain/K319L-like, PKD domain